MKTFSTIFFLFLSSLALADQCQLLNKDLADRARLLLKPGAEVMFFCMPCGDLVKDSSVEVIKTVESIESNGSFELVLNKSNNQPFDLAYFYLKVAPKTFVNLAKVVGCPAKDIPGSISLE